MVVRVMQDDFGVYNLCSYSFKILIIFILFQNLKIFMGTENFSNTIKKRHLSTKAAASLEDWGSLDIGECKWTSSGKFFVGAFNSEAEGLLLRVWSLQCSAIGEWELLPAKSYQLNDIQFKCPVDGCPNGGERLFEMSSWDDGEKGFAVAFLSLHSSSKHNSRVDNLCIWKSEIDKPDSVDEIIDLTHLIPSYELYGGFRQLTLSPDGSTLVCSLPNFGEDPELLIIKNPLDRNNLRLFHHSLEPFAHIITWAPDSRLLAVWGGSQITFLEVNADVTSNRPIIGSVVLEEQVWGYPHPLRFLRKSSLDSNNFLYVLGNTIKCFQIRFNSAEFAASAGASSATYRPPSIVPFFSIQVNRYLEFGWLCEDPHLPVFYALKRSAHPVELHCYSLNHLRLLTQESGDNFPRFELDKSHTSRIWQHPTGHLSGRHQLEANPRFPVLGVVEWEGPTFKVTCVDTSVASVRLRFVASLQTLALRALLSRPALYEAERHAGRLPNTLHDLLSRPINFPSITALVA